ncbi:hypothetical protein BN970_06954 [Mycolicibacterium conceptionense]|uniref:Uncharacterized protein n=1 Tax=Mycolicibacterium conceptionense TaxID=451644 RepID=A0A0U1E122_9MYCO|nr:hypothetical protein [Mycolicibacterium conceptionense]CQD25156.1 hypothetical protein BN970_06954 [Mycolicibacterium conceptionense]
MSEPTAADLRVRVAPKRRDVKLDDLTILVRVPGNPVATATFAADEADEAQRYADEHAGAGAVIVPLPGSIPDPVWDWETKTWAPRTGE